MLKTILNKVLTICLMAIMLPSMVGFAFIYHYCFDCNIDKKDAVLFVAAHSHDNADCFCNDLHSNQQSCCKIKNSHSEIQDNYETKHQNCQTKHQNYQTNHQNCQTKHHHCDTNNHHSDNHNNFCQIDFKKLEFTATKCQYERVLPFSVELDTFVGLLPNFANTIANNNYTELSEKYLFPPPFFDTELNILNCIFRL